MKIKPSIFLILSLFCSHLCHAQWTGAVTEPISISTYNDIVSEKALVADHGGNLHMLFQREVATWQFEFYYSNKPNGGAWSAPTRVGDVSKTNQFPYLAIDKINNVPHLVYLEDNKLKLAVCYNGAWIYFDLNTPSGLNLFYPSIAVDKNGDGHIAVIQEKGGVHKIGYGLWTNNQFSYQTISISNPDNFPSSPPAICVLSNGSAMIAYLGMDTQIHTLWNSSLGGTVWSSQTMAVPGFKCYSPSLATHPNDDVSLAFDGHFMVGAPSDIYYFFKPAGGSWSNFQKANGALQGSHAKVQVDSSGAPHIIFEETSGNFYLENICYAHKSGGTWVSQVLISSSKRRPSFVLDDFGKGSLIYQEHMGFQDNDIYYFGSAAPTLTSNVSTISQTTGGSADLSLMAGPVHMNRPYLIFGSLGGPTPGTPLPGQYVTLPINWDLFTNIVLANLNSVMFSNFLGTLDANGQAAAQFSLWPTTGALGLKISYAYALAWPWNFASNPIVIEIVL